MMDEYFLNQRLTIHQFHPPFRNPSRSPPKQIKNKPTVVHYSSQKKIFHNPEDQKVKFLRYERRSQQLQKLDERNDRMGALPQIRSKSKTLDIYKGGEDSLASIGSRKLSVNAYRKIEKAICSKYKLKMESLSMKPNKLFTINNIKTDLPAKQTSPEKLKEWQERGLQKNPHFAIIQKHHIDRLRDQFEIPLELQTIKCPHQEYDNHQINLQLKNMIRFEFNTQMNFKKRKEGEKAEERVKIEGWEMDYSSVRGTQLYSRFQ